MSDTITGTPLTPEQRQQAERLPRHQQAAIHMAQIPMREPRKGEIWCQVQGHGYSFAVDSHGKPATTIDKGKECMWCFIERNRETHVWCDQHGLQRRNKPAGACEVCSPDPQA